MSRSIVRVSVPPAIVINRLAAILSRPDAEIFGSVDVDRVSLRLHRRVALPDFWPALSAIIEPAGTGALIDASIGMDAELLRWLAVCSIFAGAMTAVAGAISAASRDAFLAITAALTAGLFAAVLIGALIGFRIAGRADERILWSTLDEAIADVRIAE